jgi:N-acetyl sugar amidotransferase
MNLVNRSIMTNFNRCDKCILPTSYPGLIFDSQNICNKCKEHDTKFGSVDFNVSEPTIKRIFETSKKKQNRYDCVIGLSGGKDSSYVAYLCVEKYHLNPLCVTFDNGFLSENASENIKNIVGKLKVDHVLFKPEWPLMQRLYKHFLLTTGEFCTPCNIGINSLIYDVAKKNKIPLIISGFSVYTDAAADINMYHISPEYFSRVVADHFQNEEIRSFLNITTPKRAYYHLSGKIKYITLPRYVKWQESEFIKLLKTEFGWNMGGSITTEHSDCIASSLKEYLRIKEFGFSEKTLKFSVLVRNGYMSREEALEKVVAFEEDILSDKKGEIKEALHLLNINDDELDQAITKRQSSYIPRSAKIMDKLMNNESLMKILVYR